MATKDITTKVCPRCKVEKDLSLYQKDKSRKLGVQKYCKECRYLQFLEAKDTSHYKLKRKEYNAKRTQYYIEYRNANRDKCNLNSRKWVEKNKEKRSISLANYSAKRRSIKKQGDSHKVIYEWSISQKKVCYWCKCDCKNDYHIDHYDPLSKGGTHSTDNLVIACPKCNITKNAKDPYKFANTLGRLF